MIGALARVSTGKCRLLRGEGKPITAANSDCLRQKKAGPIMARQVQQGGFTSGRRRTRWDEPFFRALHPKPGNRDAAMQQHPHVYKQSLRERQKRKYAALPCGRCIWMRLLSKVSGASARARGIGAPVGGAGRRHAGPDPGLSQPRCPARNAVRVTAAERPPESSVREFLYLAQDELTEQRDAA